MQTSRGVVTQEDLLPRQPADTQEAAVSMEGAPHAAQAEFMQKAGAAEVASEAQEVSTTAISAQASGNFMPIFCGCYLMHD